MREGAILLGLVAALAACGGSEPSAAPTPTPTPTLCGPSGTELKIATDADFSFDKDCLATPANKTFTITFNNTRPISHDVSIYFDRDFSKAPIFAGEIVQGPVIKTYEVKALPAAIYQFRCSVHPRQMQGDFVVQ